MSLLFNVAQLLKEPPGFSRPIAAEGEVSTTEEGASTRVTGRAWLTRTDQGVWVEGLLKATLETECSRCLTSFCQWIALGLSDLYVAIVDLKTGKRVQPSEGDGHFLIDEHHTLDLTEGVRQYAIAAAPLRSLCSAQCLGLCPDCGANLNEGPCGCSSPIDPRWEPLKGLFKAGMGFAMPAIRKELG